MWSTQCLIYSIFSASYVVYLVLHMWSIKSQWRSQWESQWESKWESQWESQWKSASYVIYQKSMKKSMRCFICNLLKVNEEVNDVVSVSRYSELV